MDFLKLAFIRFFLIVLIYSVNNKVDAFTKDSLDFKPSFYITTRPVTDALLAPNIQVGFRTSDFNNVSRNQYLQAGFTYGNYALLSTRRNVLYSSNRPNNINYSAELDYRFLLRKNKFWSPHIQITYCQIDYERFYNLNKITGLIYEAGIQNGRIYHKPGKSMMNSIHWGAGVLRHRWQSYGGANKYDYTALIVYLNWQFGQKSEK